MKVLVSGVAGFIGGHVAQRYLDEGASVVGFDNLSRRGNVENIRWLSEHAESKPGRFEFLHCEIRNETDCLGLFEAHKDADVVIHLAGQVAVTTSFLNPRMDFEANALGTLNLLEATRLHTPKAAFVFASTNKVYGGMEQVEVVLDEQTNRYRYADYPDGIPETAPLDFHSPYGCSKGTADQYVRDYARMYDLNTVVFRQSCIYGTRQFGVEDQGWIAWFTIARLLGKPITVYGDGRQVRDTLWVDDLVDLYQAAVRNMETARGKVYNAGGGAANTLSLLELIDHLKTHTGNDDPVAFDDWRPGDQRCFIADVSKAKADLGWSPKTPPSEGVLRLSEWATRNRSVLERVLGSAGQGDNPQKKAVEQKRLQEANRASG
ncbi:MAG: GDP-mannose 4,6-dehydratase [Planctomycetota bacterium]